MIAGHDYLYARNIRTKFWTKTRIAGASLLVAGAVLIGGGAAYYGFVSASTVNLDRYNASAVELVPVLIYSEQEPLSPYTSPNPMSELSLFSGDVDVTWNTGPVLPEGFVVLDEQQIQSLSSAAPATSLSIPSIDISASVVELAILDLGDRRAYETPDKVVGHIPGTANAGELGSGWYFGHTESPILDEGSVFFNLQEVPDLLNAGEQVYVITDNGTDQFLYRVTETQAVHENELNQGDVLASAESGVPTIHLVSCVPRLIYDHRLIVEAELFAVKAQG